MEPSRILEPGFGYFQIIKINDTDQKGNPLISKSGIPMLKLTLNVTDQNGKTEPVYDYLLANIEWKLKALCSSIEGSESAILFSNNTWNKEPLSFGGGFCTIKTDVSSNPRYGDKSVISTYLPREAPHGIRVRHVMNNPEVVEIDSLEAKIDPASIGDGQAFMSRPNPREEWKKVDSAPISIVENEVLAASPDSDDDIPF